MESKTAPAIVRFSQPALEMEAAKTSFENSFKISILTLTNTTSSSLYGIDYLNFFDLNNFTKISLITFMIFGKIEIIAFFYLIKRFFFKE